MLSVVGDIQRQLMGCGMPLRAKGQTCKALKVRTSDAKRRPLAFRVKGRPEIG